ncbi:MAG: hypothetical protein K8S54_06220 [Spirochaetia bacterium]|nr:hypothetical protein [Spirochaetia bacterium]
MNRFSRAHTILFACIFSSGSLIAAPNLYSRLLQANPNWVRISAKEKAALDVPVDLTEVQLLKTHLRLVEESLRAVDTTGLTQELRAERAKNLEALHDYWTREASPGNDLLPYRNPVFIDGKNRICAVGYLMLRSGQGELATMLSKLNDTIFIRDIDHPEFLKWAASSGLTIDELAWIQPMYGPENEQVWAPVGKGIQGEVNAITMDSSGRIYAAGKFDRVDGNKFIQNIAQFNGTSWQSLGQGTNGPVSAIVTDSANVYVAGEFGQAGGAIVRNVAAFDRKQKRWKALGDGLSPVRNLILFQGQLYASGNFAADEDQSKARYLKRWNPKEKTWDAMGDFNGAIRSMVVYRDELIVGGDFTKNGKESVLHIARFDGKEWRAAGGGVEKSFSAITIFKDQVFVGALSFSNQDPDTLTCLASMPSWDGKTWKNNVIAGDPFLTSSHGCNSSGEITALTPVENALAMSYANDDAPRAESQAPTLSFLTWVELETGEKQLTATGTMFTGLSKINTMLVTQKQLLMAGTFETGRGPYLESARWRNSLGRNVLPYYRLQSGFNRFQYGRIKGDSMFLPAELWK